MAVPSETVYGLAADGLNPDACAKIFEAKKRPPDDPLILHIHDLDQANHLSVWSREADQLAEAFWPGPLTLILPKRPIVPDIVTSGLPSVAIRMPFHPVFRSLLAQLSGPLAAPSANPFGYISPTSAQHVLKSLGGRIPAILDGGDCEIGLESTILDLRDPKHPRLLRPGAISASEIAEQLGTEVSKPIPKETEQSLSPGLQLRHYSPRKPLVLIQNLPTELKDDEFLIVFSNIPTRFDRAKNVRSLSPHGDGQTAGKRLFALLRQADESNYQKLFVELPPLDVSWADAITDRLRRAAAKA